MRFWVGIFLLAACHRGPEITPFRGPDGSDGWYYIRCGRDRAECLHIAGRTCPDGYRVVDSRGKTGAESLITGEFAIHCRL